MLDTVKAQFLEIYRACRDLTEEEILTRPDDPFRPHLQKLNRLATLEIDDHRVEKLLSDSDLQSAIPKIAALKRVHGLRMETDWAKKITGSTDPWAVIKRFVYYPNYLQLAAMEFEGAELKQGDRVVFLGSGPLPLSLIALVSRHAVEGIGIEKEQEHAELSREVIAGLELSGRIQIIPGDQSVLPLPHPCQLIMVGADAMPKEDIFTHLARVLPVGTKISYRIYEKGLRRLLDVQSVFDLPVNLREYKRIRPKPPVNNTSVFVIKDSAQSGKRPCRKSC